MFRFENSEVASCLVIQNFRRPICIDNLAGVFGVVLPVTEPALELLRFGDAGKLGLDRRATFTYTVHKAIRTLGHLGHWDPCYSKQAGGFLFVHIVGGICLAVCFVFKSLFQYLADRKPLSVGACDSVAVNFHEVNRPKSVNYNRHNDLLAILSHFEHGNEACAVFCFRRNDGDRAFQRLGQLLEPLFPDIVVIVLCTVQCIIDMCLIDGHGQVSQADFFEYRWRSAYDQCIVFWN